MFLHVEQYKIFAICGTLEITSRQVMLFISSHHIFYVVRIGNYDCIGLHSLTF